MMLSDIYSILVQYLYIYVYKIFKALHYMFVQTNKGDSTFIASSFLSLDETENIHCLRSFGSGNWHWFQIRLHLYLKKLCNPM